MRTGKHRSHSCSAEAITPTATLWNTTPIHLIDFEGSIASGIVEYGIVTVQHGNIVQSTGRLCQATGTIPKEHSQVHGIRLEHTRHAEPFRCAWSQFIQLRRTGPLGAHHACYENGLLRAVWSHPPYCTDFLNPHQAKAQWAPWVDTYQLYRHYMPHLPSYKLNSLVATMGLQATLDEFASEHCPPERCRYHCALYDALAAAILLLHLVQIDSSGTSFTLRKLLLYSRPDPITLAQQELF